MSDSIIKRDRSDAQQRCGYTKALSILLLYMEAPTAAYPWDVMMVLAVSFISFLLFHKYDPYTTLPVVFLLGVVPVALGTSSFVIRNYELLAIPVTIMTYWASILFFILAYRVSPFHPLAKFPGPFLNKISKFVMVKVVSEGHAHLYYQQLHHKYGDIVRVGPNELSYCNVDGVPSILGAQGLLFKGPYYANRTPISSLLCLIHPSAHTKRRRMWGKAFTGPALKDYDQIAIRRVRELANSLNQRKSESIDLSKWMGYYTFDFMGDLVFNLAFEMMKEGSDSYGYRELLTGSLELVAMVAHVPWSMMFVRYVINPGNRGRYLLQLSQKMIEKRAKGVTMIKDLYHYISNEGGDGAEIPDRRQVIIDAGTAIIAGSDTSSVVLTALWYYLLRNPVYFSRLREEVDVVFPSKEEPTDSQRLSEMPFLNACLNEAMRLQPPVPSGSPRTVTKGSGGKMVGKYFIPEQGCIFVHVYSLHRDPRFFSPYSNDFWPDRWLEPKARKSFTDPTKPLGPNVMVTTNQEAFLPFSTGPRSCVGKNVAMSEMRIVASHFVQQFDMKVAPGYDLDEWEKTLEDYFVLKNGRLLATLTERR